MRSDTAPAGLARSPRLRAAALPASHRHLRRCSDDTITTGHGRCSMIRSRHSRPSICGICTSSVMTSGLNASSCCQRLDAVARELQLRTPARSPSTRPNSLRTSAESSTTRTLITHRLGRLVWKVSSTPCSARRQQLRRIEQQHDAPRLLEVDDAAHQPRDIVREFRRRLDDSRRYAQHVRDAVDDESRAMALGLDDHEPAAFGVRASACRSVGADRRPAALRRADSRRLRGTSASSERA